jgi:uncharacterized alpha-E superfamily protein
LLSSCSALHGYRDEHGHVEPKQVIAFLFLSERFVRSVRFCIREVYECLKSIPIPPGVNEARTAKRLAGRAFNDIDLATVDDLLTPSLHQYIDSLQTRLNEIGQAIFQTHVLYADQVPVDLNPAPTKRFSVAPLGAWHGDTDLAMTQQQQQQQQ